VIFFVLVSLASALVALAGLVLLRGERRPVAVNYRGKRLRAVLGMATSFAVIVLAAFAYVVSGHWGAFRQAGGLRVWLWVSVMSVFLAGWYDDLHAGRGRGLAGHLRELGRGRITPGIVKLVAIVAASVIVSVAATAGVARVLLGVPVIAGCANLWNLLDVRPGRSVKFFLVAAAVLAPFAAPHQPLIVPAAFGAALLVLPIDLGERAMLGDSGSNLLGFVIGVALFLTLPVWGLAVALVIVMFLHYVAETLTLSRAIERTAPLRWFDRLGRAPEKAGREGAFSRDVVHRPGPR
jgi:UDP-N-acetylmuramyl pentapeptide phosphotransferase/UDP-N-acetylglucosamine-1-phosphate transferase